MRSEIVSLALLSTTLLACQSDPPPPNEVRARIAQDLRYVLTEGQSAVDGSTASLPTGSAFGFATRALDDTGATARLVAPMQRLFVSKDRNQNVDGDEEAGGLDTDEIIDMLNNELFTDANHLGDGVYQVPASLVCEDGDVDCATNLAKAQLRIRVEDDDDALKFWLQVDANHDEPLGIKLGHDELAVTLDLDEATDAMIALAPLFGEQAPNADLRGRVTSSIKIVGHAHASASVSFDRALSIKFADQGVSLESDGAFQFASAAGDIFDIDLDGNAAKADLGVGLGLTTIHVPSDEVEPSIDVVLGGATVNAHAQGNTLALTNLSLGQQTTTVHSGSVLELSIDLNPNDGRKLDATVTVDAAGNETLTVSPKLDLQTFTADAPNPYNVTRVTLDGSLRGNELVEQLEVLSGSFSIQTNPAQYGFSATAGQCVIATDIYDETTYTSWTQYSVGACQ
jgi:hypothetical protein